MFFTISILLISTRGELAPRFKILEKNNCKYEKNYQYISKIKKNKIEKDLNQNLSSTTIRKLNIDCNDGKSTAFILNDKVRTHYQTLLIWLDDTKLKAIEVLEFNEPKKYQAPITWYSNIYGKSSKELFKVDALTGATLTRQSTIKLLNQAFYLNKK